MANHRDKIMFFLNKLEVKSNYFIIYGENNENFRNK